MSGVAGRLRTRLHEVLRKLAAEHTSTPRLSAAVGLGAFIGSTPLFGLHTPIALGLSRLLRLNVFAVVLGTQVSLPFLAPGVVLASVQVGHRLLTGAWLDAAPTAITLEVAREAMVEWVLGSVIVGSGLALIGAALTAPIVSLVRWRRTRRADKAWTGKMRGTAAGHALYFFLIRTFGRRGAYLILVFVVAYYYLFAWGPRRASFDYLRRVLGPRTFLQRQLDTWRHFTALGRSLVDRVLIMVGRTDAFTYDHENVERILDAHRAGNGVVLLSAHVGSWSFAADLLGGVKPTIVVQDEEAASIREFYRRHEREPAKIIAINDSPTSAVSILQALRSGEIVAMHADRVREGTPAIDVPFLGDTIRIPIGPFRVAQLSGAPIIMTFSMKVGAKHHHFFALPPRAYSDVPREKREATIRESALWYARELETVVRRYPYQWYNFYDVWVTPPAE